MVLSRDKDSQGTIQAFKQLSYEVWEQNTEGDVDIMREFDEELVCVVGNMAGVQYLKTLLEPVEPRDKNGEKSF
ncbi:hypothetical protein EC957_002513, partial [Mortierella hygrophila]